MALGMSDPGLLLLDSNLTPVACNSQAAQILAFPNLPENIKRWHVFLTDRVRTNLVEQGAAKAQDFVREFKSGKRRYICRAFRLQYHENGARPSVAVLLERTSSNYGVLTEVAQQFDLTHREYEAVELLLQGLTTKEIAARMGISPNTVKAFLRLVMVKMGVSTRSGIVGRIARP